MSMRWYHGTRTAFRRGGYLFPRSAHGGVDNFPSIPDTEDYVFVTPDFELASAYAHRADGLGAPRVLEVQPADLSVDDTTVGGHDVESYRASMAKVLRVHMIAEEPAET